MRALEVLVGAGPAEMTAALRRALANDGAAVLPREAGADAAAHAALGDPVGARMTPLPSEVVRSVALVIETSGSSGVPKRVALSADAVLASAAAAEGALGGGGQWLLALPTHYIAGVQVLVRSIMAGTTPVVNPAGHFSAQTFARAADDLEAPLRFTSVVPAQLARLVTAAEADAGIRASVARFDAILVGGQALPAPMHERATELGFRIVRTYGSSETAGGCVYDGRPIGRTIARISGGEVELSGPSLAEGYLGDPDLTEQRFLVDDGIRWYRTDDGGSVVDGIVSVSGRLDNVIISGGVKVSLDRVERIVQWMPGFEQAVVVARESEEWGQVSVVVVEGSGGAVPGVSVPGASVPDASVPGVSVPGGSDADRGALEQIRAAVVEAAGRAAAPVDIVRVARLPRLSSGKPDRQAIGRSLQAAAR